MFVLKTRTAQGVGTGGFSGGREEEESSNTNTNTDASTAATPSSASLAFNFYVPAKDLEGEEGGGTLRLHLCQVGQSSLRVHACMSWKLAFCELFGVPVPISCLLLNVFVFLYSQVSGPVRSGGWGRVCPPFLFSFGSCRVRALMLRGVRFGLLLSRLEVDIYRRGQRNESMSLLAQQTGPAIGRKYVLMQR